MNDLCSANDQMTKIVTDMAESSHDTKLKQALKNVHYGINKHADTTKELLKDAGEEVELDYCKGMHGLVKEANNHITKHAPAEGELLDLEIIAQCQRMSHYAWRALAQPLRTPKR